MKQSQLSESIQNLHGNITDVQDENEKLEK